MLKLLYTTAEARVALGCGTTKFYQLLNEGFLEARRLGRRTYVTAKSLEALVASLPPAVTPTMAKAEHEKWSAHRKPCAKPHENDPDVA